VSLFDAAVAFILRHEGGLVNDPADPGKLTKFGISSRAFPDVDVANLTPEGATEIYRVEYWERLRCDDLPAQVAVLVFDCSVNQGPGTAAKLLQAALNIRQDGVVGPITLLAAHERAHDDLAAELVARRALEYARSPRLQLEKFGLGWMRRLADCHRFAMVQG
jgi:lysozyme family protein